MLYSIIPLIQNKGRLIKILHYDSFIKNTKNLIDKYIQNTYQTSNPITSKGINLLQTILFTINLNDFLAISNLTDQLFYIKQYIIDETFTTIIGNTNKSIIASNAFIKSNIFSPIEIIIPIPKDNPIDFYQNYIISHKQYILSSIKDNQNPIIPLAQLPISNKNLLPFKLIYNNTNELSLNIKQGKLLYSIDTPSTVVYILHIEKLFMGLAYYLKMYEDQDQDICIRNYLYQWCILPILNDTFDVWIMNIINFVLESTRNDTYKNNNLKEQIYNGSFIEHSTFGYIFQGTSTKWIDDIQSLINKLSNGNITITDLLISIQLPSGYSLFQYLYYIVVDNELPELIQAQWLKFIKNYSLFKLILQLLDIAKEPSRINIIKSLYRVIRQYRNNHIWIHCPDRILKQMIKNEIDSSYQWLKSNI